jgi:hypothetical protein
MAAAGPMVQLVPGQGFEEIGFSSGAVHDCVISSIVFPD